MENFKERCGQLVILSIAKNPEILHFVQDDINKGMNTLILDTADNKKIAVGLIINGKKDIQVKRIISNKTQIILFMIDEILKRHSLKPEDISEININAGPGSFTGLRVGLAIANALSFVLKIPVNDKKVGEIILPLYNK